MTERDKMLAGELYDPLDPDLVAARERARDLCQGLNQTRESERELRRSLLCDLFEPAVIRLDAIAILLRLRLEHLSWNADIL
jgi:Maltose acetyltransferase.